MDDDEDWHVYPNGLEVFGKNQPQILTTRDEEGRLHSIDTLTGERLGPEDPTPEEAEARSIELRRQRAQSVFTDPMWPVDRVLSWIGYRDVEAIEEPFAPALYEDSRPVVDGIPRIALLRALQEDRLRAIRQQGKLVDRIHPDEWAYVRRDWSINRWHECLFARFDVVALWPEIAAAINYEQKPVSLSRRTGESRKALKGRPWKCEHIDLLKTWITENPMPQGLDRTCFEDELKLRYGAIERKLARKLHQDPDVHPGKPRFGPHKSAGSLGKK